MFGKSVEVEAFRNQVEVLKEELTKTRFELSCQKRENELKVQEELNKLKKEMQKSLVESDIRRERAEAKLETYEKMDTKSERNEIREMLKEAIKGLSGNKVQIVK